MKTTLKTLLTAAAFLSTSNLFAAAVFSETADSTVTHQASAHQDEWLIPNGTSNTTASSLREIFDSSLRLEKAGDVAKARRIYSELLSSYITKLHLFCNLELSGYDAADLVGLYKTLISNPENNLFDRLMAARKLSELGQNREAIELYKSILAQPADPLYPKAFARYHLNQLAQSSK